MSIAALNWAFRLRVQGAAKVVLIALADHANDDGEAWPAVSRLEQWTGLKDRGIRLALKHLEASGVINRSGKNGTTVIYKMEVGAEYNPARSADIPARDAAFNPAPDADNPARSAINPARRADKPLITTKEPLSIPPLIPPTSKPDPMAEFADWWQHYPRKVGKGQARRAFVAARKKVSLQILTDAILAYPFDMTRPEFIPHASTWLNGERWADEIDTRDPVLVAVGYYDGPDKADKLESLAFEPSLLGRFH